MSRLGDQIALASTLEAHECQIIIEELVADVHLLMSEFIPCFIYYTKVFFITFIYSSVMFR